MQCLTQKHRLKLIESKSNSKMSQLKKIKAIKIDSESNNLLLQFKEVKIIKKLKIESKLNLSSSTQQLKRAKTKIVFRKRRTDSKSNLNAS